MPNERFLAKYRIRRGTEFQRAFRRRASAADGSIIVYGHPNGFDYPRLGLSVSRRVGPAVARNRWKRLLREAFRHARPDLPPGVDLVVVPRVGVEPTFAALADSLRRLAARVARKLS